MHAFLFTACNLTCVYACIQCMYPARHSRASYHDVCLADSWQHSHTYTDRFSTVICRCGLSQLYSRHSLFLAFFPGAAWRTLQALSRRQVCFWTTITALPRRGKSLRNATAAPADNALSADSEPSTCRITSKLGSLQSVRRHATMKAAYLVIGLAACVSLLAESAQNGAVSHGNIHREL